MSVFVVDASVGCKWFVPEQGDVEAARLRTGHSLHVPELFFVEVASVLRKKVRQGDILHADADDILRQLPGLAIQTHRDLSLLLSALEMSLNVGISIYDAVYLALAVHLNGQLVTADDVFVGKVAATVWATSVLRLQDIP